MINLKVNKVWQGQIAIRDKYIHQAQQTKEDIQIMVEGRKMIIPFVDIDKGRKSSEDFYDKFSNSRHYLYYFLWKPINENQQSLF